MIWTEKLSRFLFYHQEMLANLNFEQVKIFLPEKDLLEKAATIKRFEYLPLCKAFAKQTDVIKKQTGAIKRKREKVIKL